MIPEGWTCPRRIGFLFPHGCGRLTPIGCPDCDGGRLTDPFAQRVDRYSYTDYDDYSSPGVAGWHHQNDFTEADGENMIRRRQRFEEDTSAS